MRTRVVAVGGIGVVGLGVVTSGVVAGGAWLADFVGTASLAGPEPQAVPAMVTNSSVTEPHLLNRPDDLVPRSVTSARCGAQSRTRAPRPGRCVALLEAFG